MAPLLHVIPKYNLRRQRRNVFLRLFVFKVPTSFIDLCSNVLLLLGMIMMHLAVCTVWYDRTVQGTIVKVIVKVKHNPQMCPL